MTGTRPSELKLWLEDYLAVGEIGETLKQAGNPSLPDNLSIKARKRVIDSGWKNYDALTPRDRPNRLTEEYFNDVHNYAFAENHAKGEQHLKAKRAAKRLESKLDDIVAELPEEGLIGILSDKESAAAIGAHAPKDHKEWVGKYSEYMSYLQLAEKAKRGELSDQERISLRAPMVRKRAQQVNEKLRAEGIKDDLFIQSVSAIVAEDVEREYMLDREAYVKAIEELAKDELVKLRKYESGKRQNVRSYIGGALKGLMKDGNSFETGAEIVRRIAKDYE